MVFENAARGIGVGVWLCFEERIFYVVRILSVGMMCLFPGFR